MYSSIASDISSFIKSFCHPDCTLHNLTPIIVLWSILLPLASKIYKIYDEYQLFLRPDKQFTDLDFICICCLNTILVSLV